MVTSATVTSEETINIIGAATNFNNFYLTMVGEDDFGGYVFERLNSGRLTSTQASYLWEYSDGYKMVITSSIANIATTVWSSVHCFKKTRS